MIVGNSPHFFDEVNNNNNVLEYDGSKSGMSVVMIYHDRN